MNKLPNGWQIKTLGDIFLIERGSSPRPIKSFLTNDNNGINWIKIGDAKNNSKYIYQSAEKIRPVRKKIFKICRNWRFNFIKFYEFWTTLHHENYRLYS